jgi:DNA-binding transcriptional MerR regulator/methylmalonyl-CoA mutase cobalamin-binding subunit
MGADPQLWPMGAVTRRTGIGEHTLRAWERRFGFPHPERLASGHRRYPADQVRRLLLIAEALRCGYRAGDVVPLPTDRLEGLLRASGRVDESTGELAPEWIQRVLEAGRRFDRHRLLAQLTHAAATMGLVAFLRERVDPIMLEVGNAWARGDLQVRHEHFISEVVEDVLRSLRGTLDQATTGRPVVLANLPGELHQLGLQIAGLVIAASGRSQTILGGNTPVEDIVAAANAVDAAAIGLSISIFADPVETVQGISTIRSAMPSRTRLWLGGSGARLVVEHVSSGVQVLDTLEDLERALRDLRD